jgi:hypothetical protein
MLDTYGKPRLRLLLDHFALIEDAREGWRVAHPLPEVLLPEVLLPEVLLPEVLLLVVCGTIAAGDDFEDIADRGGDNLAFLRRFLPCHHGVPGARWLRILLNRLDPGLFADGFRAWATALRPDAPDLVAIDGKTSRGSPDRDSGRAALHLVSAFATRERLVIGQEAVATGSCEQDTIPLFLARCFWPAASGAARRLRKPRRRARHHRCHRLQPHGGQGGRRRRRRLSDRRQGQPAWPHGRDRALLRRSAKPTARPRRGRQNKSRLSG